MRCLGCHVEGQIGPFALDGYDNASTHAAIASRAVETGLMPPFRADDSDCWTIAIPTTCREACTC